MLYTVGEMAKKLGVAASALRYYDKEGLLPFVERTDGGIRMFTDKDYEWLYLITCLKKSGMSISEIKDFAKLASEGDSTISQRQHFIDSQRMVMLSKVKEMLATLDDLDYNYWLYDKAKKDGSFDNVCNISENDVPEKLKDAYKRIKGINQE